MISEAHCTMKRTKLELILLIFVTISIVIIFSLGIVIFLEEENLNFSESEYPAEELKLLRMTPLKSNKEPHKSKICVSPACVHAASKLLNKIDPSIEPCDDFYTFACGKFIKENFIHDDRSSATVFRQLGDKVKEQLRMVLEENRTGGQPHWYQSVKNLYSSCMNKSGIENRGLNPVINLINAVGGWPVLDGTKWSEVSFSWAKTAYKLRNLGFPVDYLLDFSVDVDMRNSTKRIIRMGQASLSLGREYLTKSFDYKTLHAYFQYQVDIAVALGAEKHSAEKEMKDATLFEMRLANSSLPKEERRNASRLFNVMTIADLQTKFPSIPWLEYINQMLPQGINVLINQSIAVDDWGYVKQLEIALNTTNKRVLANYMIWRAVSSIVQYAPVVLRNIELKSSGKSEGESRWRECTDIVNNRLHLATGFVYVQKFFKQEAKTLAKDLVANIKTEFMKILQKLGWMDDETRAKSTEKAEAMSADLAYPEELLNSSLVDQFYQNLEISKNFYLESMLNVSKFLMDKNFEKLGQENVKKTEWESRQIAVVNAFYNKMANSIQLPAGILQPPFFSPYQPGYLNYGGIGFVTGHEIVHGFDDQGRQFDKNGHLVDWWAKNTEKKFLKKAQCIIDQYGNYTIKDTNLKINGFHTQGENIADNGGIKMAYKAYVEWVRRNGEEDILPGLQYSSKQLFWINAASIWCAQHKAEALKLKVVTDVHTTQMYRVIGSFSNIDDFAKDFKCPVGSRMNPVKKCVVW